MCIKSDYFDFFLNGISFASNAYSYEAFKTPWDLENGRLVKIRNVWSKNLWISSIISLSSLAASIAISKVAASYINLTLPIAFLALSIFSSFRACVACDQNFLWSQERFNWVQQIAKVSADHIKELDKELEEFS